MLSELQASSNINADAGSETIYHCTSHLAVHPDSRLRSLLFLVPHDSSGDCHDCLQWLVWSRSTRLNRALVILFSLLHTTDLHCAHAVPILPPGDYAGNLCFVLQRSGSHRLAEQCRRESRYTTMCHCCRSQTNGRLPVMKYRCFSQPTGQRSISARKAPG